MPSIDHYMTREPVSVAPNDNLEKARHLMQTHLIRHLPVVEGDKLVGVLSERDIAVMEALPGIDLAHVEISRVMAPAIYTWGETPLDEVSELMTRQKADCVVVRGGHGIKGIFTATDALQALADLVRRATA